LGQVVNLTTIFAFHLIIVKSSSTKPSKPSFRRGKASHAKTGNWEQANAAPLQKQGEDHSTPVHRTSTHHFAEPLPRNRERKEVKF